jgi:hypothetical protein
MKGRINEMEKRRKKWVKPVAICESEFNQRHLMLCRKARRRKPALIAMTALAVTPLAPVAIGAAIVRLSSYSS